MRRFLDRFKVRTLLIAMAAGASLFGVGLGTAHLQARSTVYRAKAADYAFKEEMFAKHLQYALKMAGETKQADRECTEQARLCTGMDRLRCLASLALFRTQTTRHQETIARYQAKAEWYTMMKNRYQIVSARPWLSLPPEPPEPR